jgi:hypothetical protein
LGGQLIQRLSTASTSGQEGTSSVFQGGEVITCQPGRGELGPFLKDYHQARQVEVGLAVAIYSGQETQDVHLALITPNGERLFTRPYGGPPEYAPRWAINHSLDLLRRLS